MRKFWILSTFIVTQNWEKKITWVSLCFSLTLQKKSVDGCLKTSSWREKPVIRESLTVFFQV